MEKLPARTHELEVHEPIHHKCTYVYKHIYII